MTFLKSICSCRKASHLFAVIYLLNTVVAT